MCSRSWRRTLRLPRPRHRGGLDGVLELVDLLVQVVDQVEVPLGDVVDEPVEHHAGVVVGAARLAHGTWVVRLSPGGVLLTDRSRSDVRITSTSW